MERYCLYLRKSRADCEAEARGETETLARHEKILMELAEKIAFTYHCCLPGNRIRGDHFRPAGYAAAFSEVEKHMEWSTCRGSGASCPR